MFKKIIYSLAAVSLLTMSTSCNDWLDVKPNNEQITDEFWKSKEDVEAVAVSGYYYLQNCVPQLIKWGELRGGTFYTTNTNDARLQDFNLLATNAICDYANIYKVINAANSILKYAPGVVGIDDTYNEAAMKAHLCEAYFLRAYCNLILLKNYGSFPLVLEPYVDDTASFDIAKSTEDVIVKQIKDDVLDALATGAAKGSYEVEWQTKGRATKWALYALMADVCLWSEDYSTCKEYCDKILDATDQFRPVFMSITSQWYDMFCLGNQNESILELQWDYATNRIDNNFRSLWNDDINSSVLRFTKDATEKMKDEIDELVNKAGVVIGSGRAGRMLVASCHPEGGNAAYASAKNYTFWKYWGNEVDDYQPRLRVDNNFILYRVAEIILMKAQAECMTGNIPDAFRLVNRIRNRAALLNYEGVDNNDDETLSTFGELACLEEILLQKQMEFMGEAKRWYDLLWFGRIADGKYKDNFVNEVIAGNQTTNANWIRSVLIDPNSWYIALPYADIEHNRLLVQNPYYVTK